MDQEAWGTGVGRGRTGLLATAQRCLAAALGASHSSVPFLLLACCSSCRTSNSRQKQRTYGCRPPRGSDCRRQVRCQGGCQGGEQGGGGAHVALVGLQASRPPIILTGWPICSSLPIPILFNCAACRPAVPGGCACCVPRAAQRPAAAADVRSKRRRHWWVSGV